MCGTHMTSQVLIRRFDRLLIVSEARDCFGIWSSEQAHTVDALAAGGEEGRWSLRKASGSRQPDCEPEMSEWGNPLAQASIPYLNT
jgi:hypothetical protein